MPEKVASGVTESLERREPYTITSILYTSIFVPVPIPLVRLASNSPSPSVYIYIFTWSVPPKVVLNTFVSNACIFAQVQPPVGSLRVCSELQKALLRSLELLDLKVTFEIASPLAGASVPPIITKFELVLPSVLV